jgi:hypothetical protein
MKRYDFTVVLSHPAELTDQLVEDLFEAGCDDGSPSSRAGVVMVTLHREAESLEQAIRSGIADVQKAGCRAARVEIDLEDLVDATSRESATGG